MNIFVVGGDRLVSQMFRRAGHKITSTLEKDTDIMVFTGGADVSPFLYGERPLSATKFDINRDLIDIYFWKAADPRLPKIGICRGAQLGNVLCGGRLWQDVDGHAGVSHVIRDLSSKTKQGNYKYVWVSSTHHQQAILTDDAILLAVGNTSNRRTGYRITETNKSDWNDVEAFYYNNFNFLGVQFHPEYPNLDQCTEYFWELTNWLDIPKKKTEETPTRQSIML